MTSTAAIGRHRNGAPSPCLERRAVTGHRGPPGAVGAVPDGGVSSAPSMPTELLVATRSAEQTRSVAAALARACRGGDLLLLTGDLGAGKTTFCQGFGAALDVRTPITSPTFTLHHRYQGRLVMHHLDVYRLDQLDDTIELGLGELLESGGVTLIEWGDTIRPVLPEDHVQVSLELGAGDDDRLVRIAFRGEGWADRVARLAEELAGIGPSC